MIQRFSEARNSVMVRVIKWLRSRYTESFLSFDNFKKEGRERKKQLEMAAVQHELSNTAVRLGVILRSVLEKGHTSINIIYLLFYFLN